MKNIVFAGVLMIVLSSCCSESTCDLPHKEVEGKKEVSNESSPDVKPQEKIDYESLPLKQNGNITAVIEISAGTNHKIEYDYEAHDFKCDQVDGMDRVVKFLPYIGNYGFLPGTFMDPAIGGDGDALDVLVIGEHVKMGTVLEIIPIGVMMLLDGGEEDHKVLAVPADMNQNVLGVTKFSEVPESVKTLVQTWFSNYKGQGEMEFLRWEDEAFANKEIEKWTKK